MAQSLSFQNGYYYHLYNRGVNKMTLFKCHEEYVFFLRRVKKYLQGVDCVCYCLMPNHFHLLVRQVCDNGIPKFMQRLSTSYTMAINSKYEHSGVLFQSSYKARHIDSEEYLLHVCRYIHLNPFVAGLAVNLDRWPYSNWLEFIGKRDGTLCSKQFQTYLNDNAVDYFSFVVSYMSALHDAKIEKYMID